MPKKLQFLNYSNIGVGTVHFLFSPKCPPILNFVPVWVSCNRPLLPDPDPVVEGDSFDIPDGQTLRSRLQWEDSPDISPTDSASSKASKEGKFSEPSCKSSFLIKGKTVNK